MLLSSASGVLAPQSRGMKTRSRVELESEKGRAETTSWRLLRGRARCRTRKGKELAASTRSALAGAFARERPIVMAQTHPTCRKSG